MSTVHKTRMLVHKNQAEYPKYLQDQTSLFTEPENFPQFVRHQKAADIWKYGRKQFNRKMKEKII